MKKNWLTIIGIVFIVIGVVFGFAINGESFPQAEVLSMASVMFGAGLACANLWDKRNKEKKNWINILTLVLVGVGAFILGFFRVVEENTMTIIITTVIGLISIISGLVVTAITNKKLTE